MLYCGAFQRQWKDVDLLSPNQWECNITFYCRLVEVHLKYIETVDVQRNVRPFIEFNIFVYQNPHSSIL